MLFQRYPLTLTSFPPLPFPLLLSFASPPFLCMYVRHILPLSLYSLVGVISFTKPLIRVSLKASHYHTSSSSPGLTFLTHIHSLVRPFESTASSPHFSSPPITPRTCHFPQGPLMRVAPEVSLLPLVLCISPITPVMRPSISRQSPTRVGWLAGWRVVQLAWVTAFHD